MRWNAAMPASRVETTLDALGLPLGVSKWIPCNLIQFSCARCSPAIGISMLSLAEPVSDRTSAGVTFAILKQA